MSVYMCLFLNEQTILKTLLTKYYLRGIVDLKKFKRLELCCQSLTQRLKLDWIDNLFCFIDYRSLKCKNKREINDHEKEFKAVIFLSTLV